MIVFKPENMLILFDSTFFKINIDSVDEEMQLEITELHMALKTRYDEVGMPELCMYLR